MEKQEKLPEDFKAKWLTALRSGTYQQGECSLAHPDYNDDNEFLGMRYCCLGVAGKVMGLPDDQLKWAGIIADLREEKYLFPPVLQQPITCMTPTGEKGNVVDRLTGMNDNGISFSKIADWIEENL